MYLYTKDHAWVLVNGNTARVGISDFAQKELGEIAYVELPEAGKKVLRGDVVCTVDSLKSSSEIYAPVSGTVKEVNKSLSEEKGGGLINKDPLGEGWIFDIEMSDPSECNLLLSEKDYRSYIQGN
jgi:glycine cleavage system H protein